MRDHTPVVTYATRGMRLWAASKAPHGPFCSCLSCSDARAYVGWPPLVPNPYRVMVVPAQREERSA